MNILVRSFDDIVMIVLKVFLLYFIQLKMYHMGYQALNDIPHFIVILFIRKKLY